MELRYYQSGAVNAAYDWLRTRSGAPLIVIPTGGGKTPVIASMCRDAVDLWGGRVMVLAHVKELIEQAAEEIRGMAPGLDVGLYSAGARRADTGNAVVCAGIQSVWGKAHEFGRRDLVLIDEAHLIPPEGDGMYRTFLSDLRKTSPHFRFAGLTATPYRLTSGLIYGGPEDHFEGICYEVGVKQLIEQGFLSPLVSRPPDLQVTFDHVRTLRGEFAARDAEDCMLTHVEKAVAEVLAASKGRRKILWFCQGVEHAEEVCRLIKKAGEEAGLITGKTSKTVRGNLIDRFRGEPVQQPGSLFVDHPEPLRHLVNIDCLTTGFNVQDVDCVAILRMTQSPGLFYQMCGRGFRLHANKTDCLILDFGGNIERHGPVDAIEPKPRSERKASETEPEPATKTCPECEAEQPAGVAFCRSCGFLFPRHSSGHAETATSAAVVTGEPVLDEREVQAVDYAVHYKRNAPEGAPRTMRVDYWTSMSDCVSEWVCVEHEPGSFAHRKAVNWWHERSADLMPGDADEAVRLANLGQLAEVEAITVKETPGKRFPEVVGAKLGDVPEPLGELPGATEPESDFAWVDDFDDVPF